MNFMILLRKDVNMSILNEIETEFFTGYVQGLDHTIIYEQKT